MYEFHINNMARLLSESLAENIQVEPAEIALILTRYWDDYAVATWAIDDIVYQAEHLAWPMSNKDARNILKEIERGASAEYGITWDTLDEAISSWAEGVFWPGLPEDQLAEYTGCFVLAWKTPRRKLARYRVIAGSLAEAVRQARAISGQYAVTVPVQVISTEPWAEDDPAGSAEVGNVLMTVLNHQKENQNAKPLST